MNLVEMNAIVAIVKISVLKKIKNKKFIIKKKEDAIAKKPVA